MAEETNAGIRKRGSWNDVSDFAERFLGFLQDSGIEEKYLDEYEGWMPTKNEEEKQVKQKTAEDAALGHTEVEDKSKGVKKDLGDASKKMAEAGKKAAKKENPDQEVKEASIDIVDLFLAKLAELTRAFESELYSKVMMRFNPYYFDTEDFSADLKHQKNGKYTLTVSVPSKKLRRELKERFLED